METKITKFGEGGLHVYVKKASGLKDGDTIYLVPKESYIELNPQDIARMRKHFAQEGDTDAMTFRRLLDVFEIHEENKDTGPLVETEEELAEAGYIVKEIKNIEGNTLYLEKLGGTWPYKVKDELTKEILDLLVARKADGWKVLGMAKLKKVNDKLLTLTEVLL